MMQIAYMVRYIAVHTIPITMDHRHGHFWTSNKIPIAANKLQTFKNEFNISTVTYNQPGNGQFL